MGLLLNRCFFILLFFFAKGLFYAQKKPVSIQERETTEKDYRSKDEFKKYGKYNTQIAAWQIQNLKFGALVVRFQSNRRKIEAFRKQGNSEAENKVRAETQYYTKLMMRAYMDEFNFCKVYFMYAEYSDSLLKGARKGIFLDTTLSLDNTIEMKEQFYLIAEKDYVYNSSIGLIKEDTAKYVYETGNPAFQAPVVLKNKYGHQLKNPFPFYVNRTVFKSGNTHKINFKYIGIDGDKELEKTMVLTIPKELTLERQRYYIADLNEKLQSFYLQSQYKQATLPNISWYLY